MCIFFRLLGLVFFSIGSKCLVVMFFCIWNVVSCVMLSFFSISWCSVLLLLVWVLLLGSSICLCFFCSSGYFCIVCVWLMFSWLCDCSFFVVCGRLCCCVYVGVVMIIICVVFSCCVIRLEFFSGLVCIVMLVCCFSRLIILLLRVRFMFICGLCLRNVGSSGNRKWWLNGMLELICSCLCGLVWVLV